MKILKIEQGHGYYLSDTSQYIDIDKITKDHLLGLVNTALENEVTFDVYDEQALHNPAQRIVYKNILAKLNDLVGRCQEFKDESEKLYEKEYERYSHLMAK